MNDYTIKEFIEKFNPCEERAEWALAECSTMQEVFAKAKPGWRIWIAARPGIMSKKDLILWACKCVKKTPLANGGTVWDLLTDKRSKRAVKIAKKYAKGEVSFKVMERAANAARDVSAAYADATAAFAFADATAAFAFADAVAAFAFADDTTASRVAFADAVFAASAASAYFASTSFAANDDSLAASFAANVANAAARAAEKFQSDLLNKYELNFSKK